MCVRASSRNDNHVPSYIKHILSLSSSIFRIILYAISFSAFKNKKKLGLRLRPRKCIFKEKKNLILFIPCRYEIYYFCVVDIIKVGFQFSMQTTCNIKAISVPKYKRKWQYVVHNEYFKENATNRRPI